MRDTLTRATWHGFQKTSVVTMSQCYVIKQMVNAIACTIELWMHLGGLLSTQEARVALGMICSIGQMTTLYANMEKTVL